MFSGQSVGVLSGVASVPLFLYVFNRKDFILRSLVFNEGKIIHLVTILLLSYPLSGDLQGIKKLIPKLRLCVKLVLKM